MMASIRLGPEGSRLLTRHTLARERLVFHQTTCFALLGLLTLGSTAHAQKPEASHFTIAVRQDNQTKPVRNHVVKVIRKPLELVITFREPGGVLINASHDPASFDAARAGKEHSDLPGFVHTGIAEGLHNPDKSIFVIDEAPNYWFYQDSNEHRFDGPCRRSQVIECVRTISSLQYEGGRSVDLNASKQPALYLVIAKTKWAEGFTRRIELQRDYLKIVLE
ncbi:hypothetical protein ACFL6C_13305 [Myxococcota bacterium]